MLVVLVAAAAADSVLHQVRAGTERRGLVGSALSAVPSPTAIPTVLAHCRHRRRRRRAIPALVVKVKQDRMVQHAPALLSAIATRVHLLDGGLTVQLPARPARMACISSVASASKHRNVQA